MLIHLSHKIALEPTKEQEEYFFRAAGVARAAYNCGLNIWKDMYKSRQVTLQHNESQLAIESTLKTLGIFFIPTLCTPLKSPSMFDVKKAFNARKKKEFPWMYEVTKFASEYPIINLGKAYKNLFKGGGFPKYKSKKKGDYSFCIGNSGIDSDLNPRNKKEINVTGLARYLTKKLDVSSPLPKGKKHKIDEKLGIVKMREALRFSGRVILATISFYGGRWFVSLTVETELASHDRGETQTSVGVDLGIAALAYLSNGEKIIGPKPLRKLEKRLKRLQRRFSKTKVNTIVNENGEEIKKDSLMRKKLRVRIQKLHAHIAYIRKDSLHKLTTYLVKKFDNIFIEDLNIKGMVKNHKLAKAILDMGFYEFKSQLVYKAKMYGSRIFMVDRWFPSSKKCSCCGGLQASMPLSVRTWTCDTCETIHDRDGNAANNLNNLFDYVRLADSIDSQTENSPVTPWDNDNCTMFDYNNRVYSLKNLTAA